MYFFFYITAAICFASEYTNNIAFNHPFNPNVNHPRRLRFGPNPTTAQNVHFYHGVASGDPSSNDVVIWTRVTPIFQNKWAQNLINGIELEKIMSNYETIQVTWAISKKEENLDLAHNKCNPKTYIKCGITETSPDIDYTVKIIVDNLEPNTWYYYQFAVGDIISEIGRTRTIPSEDSNIESWRFAFGSCKQYAHGYFTNLYDIAARDDIDMMLFLGDYIYEFPNDALVNGTLINHVPYPDNFLYTLEHYRGRYLQHHLDENVQALHRRLPWYFMWDDHEVVNDYWFNGAPDKWQNDQLFDVNFVQRKINGYQAYFEWIPIRPIDINANKGLYQSRTFGNLFELLLIDGRSQRTQPAETVLDGMNLDSTEHYMLGNTQREWLMNKLYSSQRESVKWRIIGSDDPFGQSPPQPDVFQRDFFGEDKFEGYHQERQSILDHIVHNRIYNIISLVGGPHTGIAQKIYSTGKPDQNDDNSYPIFNEFICDALSAPKVFEEYNYVPYVENYYEHYNWVSPYIRFQADGYNIVDITKDMIKVEYWINYDIKTTPNTHSMLDQVFCVKNGIADLYDCNNNPIDIKYKKTKCKPGWSEWSEWSECLVDCGEDLVYRTRKCVKCNGNRLLNNWTPKGNGFSDYKDNKLCPGPHIEFQYCQGTKCD
eukprot:822050_1